METCYENGDGKGLGGGKVFGTGLAKGCQNRGTRGIWEFGHGAELDEGIGRRVALRARGRRGRLRYT